MKIRIGVLVNDEGKWIAQGSTNESDDDLMQTCRDCSDWDPEEHREREVFVEVDVPLPTTDPVVTVQGEVSP